MAIQFTVTWANSGHALLPDALADVQLEVPGKAPIRPVSRKPGVRRFEVPQGTRSVLLRASFSASFKAVGEAPAMTAAVLEVSQRYDIDEGGRVLAAPSTSFGGEHPLLHTAVNAKPGGAVAVSIRTEFVDITPFWRAYAIFADEHEAEHDPEVELVVLGSTGADPKIWFASIPAACAASPDPGVSCLVFFRPNGEKYDRIDQPHDMFGLNRYLLKPTADEDVAYWKRDRFIVNPEKGGAYCWVRCGFEDALVRSGKAVVMLHPWPSGLSYGRAVTADLPTMVEAIVRFLWAEQRIGKDRGRVHAGRLGLAGYSAGGLALWDALAANRARVDEVFAFDARGVADRTSGIVSWIRSKPEARLRMTGAYQLEGNRRVLREIQKLPGAASILSRFTCVPEDPSGYEAGVNPLWDYVLEELPDLRWNKEMWHQLAIFGGYVTEPGPEARTSLQRFLEESLF